MCLFKYREKRYGKLAFILFAVLMLVLGGASIFGGVYAVIKMTHWSKYILVVLGSIVGLIFVIFGLFLTIMSTSLINTWKSVRDGNHSIGTANKRLCDKCGRVITKHAEFCEHCGAKQEYGTGLKSCPQCKTKNSATAKFCEKCGYEFEK